MTIQSEIDETLRRLGSAEPPLGLERRVNLRLQLPRKRFSVSMTRIYAACAAGGERCSVRRGAESWFAQPGVSPPSRRSEHAGGRRATSGCPCGRGVWDCFGGSCAGAAGSCAAHAG